MAICKFFLEGRCRYGDKCWNEHPRGGGGGGRRQEQGRYDYQTPPASSRWTAPSYNQRYVQPSSFSKSTTWTRDNNQPPFASNSHDNKGRPYNAVPPTGHFSQNRYSALSSQDHSRESPPDKDGNLFETIKHDLDVWESSGQWIFSSYSVRDGKNITGFPDISPEELRLEFYIAQDSGNAQNYINTVQQLVSQWKQRMHVIRNTNIPSQSALLDELTKPAASSAPAFGGQQITGFPTTSSSINTPPKSTVDFNFKQESQFPVPSKGPVSGFPSASGFANKPATGFGNATASAATFSFAASSDGGTSGFSNEKTVTAATFSFAPTTSLSAGAPGFGATAIPASTSSTTAVPFGGSAAPFGGSTTPFVGTAPSFGASTAPFGGTTAVSGFGQSTTSTFGGASSTFGFGAPAGNTVTPGFGAKTSAVSELFKAGAATSTTSVPFGQASGFSISQQTSVTTAEASSENPIFTPRSALSARELSQFEAKRFTLGNIPLRPPPSNLLVV